MSRLQSRTDSILIVATVWIFVGSFALEPPVAFVFGVMLPILAGSGLRIRARELFQLALFCTLAALGCLLLPVGVSMPGLLVGILAYLLLAFRVPQLRGAASWLRAGELTPSTGVLMATTVVISAFGLYGWIRLLLPDVSEFMLMPEGLSLWMVPAVVLGFSMLNAAAEEIVFRGAIMHGLDTAMGAGWASIVMQAAAFGVWHIHGFPKGPVGAMMVFVYALLLGVIRRRSRGLLAVWITHIFADIVILAILLRMDG